MEGNVDDSVMVIDVEFDVLDSMVTIGAPESFRHRISCSPAVRVGNKVSFQLFLTLSDDDVDEYCGGCIVESDQVEEECHENSSIMLNGMLANHRNRLTEGMRRPLLETISGMRTVERGDDSFHCKDSGNGSYGKLDEEEEKECENPCSPECDSDSEDMKVPCNDNSWNPNLSSGENPENKTDDDCFKGEKTFGEDETYVHEECRTPEFCNGTIFQQEEATGYDDQSDFYDDQGDFYDDQSDFHDDQADFYDDRSDFSSGENPENKADDECFKGEKILGEGETYVPEECQTPEYCNGTTFQQEEEIGYDDQSDCLGSFSFDEVQHAEFLSDFRLPRSSNQSRVGRTKYACHVVPDCKVSKREKMNKTNGYKRAIEAEWDAWQQVLQNQAEEAQRLRKKRKLELSEAKKKAEEEERQLKRKKAAELRASEIKMRQEQRVKQMREAEKKDEEDWKARERYRAETRRKISLLQGQCRDLPSLLRSLGFRIAGGRNPSRGEVRRAYREALLKYHPDHWSKTNIRQQVEAEELIKLINVMRAKFFPSLY